MSTRIATVSTTHRDFGKITEKVSINIPDSLEEAMSADFYGSEEALLKAIQGSFSTDASNTVRRAFRESEVERDWAVYGQEIADSYRPGRKGGFKPKVSRDELADLTLDEIVEVLRNKGLNID
jgi:hypothetical protein